MLRVSGNDKEENGDGDANTVTAAGLCNISSASIE